MVRKSIERSIPLDTRRKIRARWHTAWGCMPLQTGVIDMIYHDDNGASLQPQDDKWPAEKAFAAMFAAGIACWVVIGAIVWLILGEVGA